MTWRLALALALVAVAAPPVARAAIDYPVVMDLPDWDVAIGLSGGLAFGESGRARHRGALVGLDVGLLQGVAGLHLGVRGWREGWGWRLVGSLEATVWYVGLFGVGVSYGAMGGEGGPDVPDEAVALTFLIAAPVLLSRLGDDGDAGALVLAPYGRPGLRFEQGGGLRGHHEVGLMLRWTSFGY